MDLIEGDTARDEDIRVARLAMQLVSVWASKDAHLSIDQFLPDREAWLDRMLGKEDEED